MKLSCIKLSAIQDEGNIINWTDWKLSPDITYILVKANHLKVSVLREHILESLTYEL